MARVKTRESVIRECDVPIWANILLDDEMPIRWTPEDAEDRVDDQLEGQLIIGEEQQIIIDTCGTAATNLLKVLIQAHRDANLPVPE